jgi:hypothetical protein
VTDVAFIGGFGRSGSTMVERVLAQLPSVCALGEVVHLWERGVRLDERCSCGEHFSSCPFWLQVGDAAFGGWDRVDVDVVARLAAQVDRTRFIPFSAAASRSSARSAVMREYGDYYARVYSAAATVSGSSLVIDSSKHASTAFVLRRHPDIALRVMHMVRDSRGVAYSWTKRVLRPEVDASSENALMQQYAPWESALLWNAHNAAFAMLGRLGTPTYRLYYEQLLKDPVRVFGELAEFLSESPALMADYVSADAVQLAPAHQIAGNPMRFQTGEVLLRRDDAWRKNLSTNDRRLVTTLTAPLLVAYGYLKHSE